MMGMLEEGPALMDRLGSQAWRVTRASAAGLVLLFASSILSSGNALANTGSARAAIGDITEYPLPPPDNGPSFIAAGPDGNLWFTDGNVAKVTTAGVFTEYPIPTAGGGASGIAAGPDGNLWFTEYGSGLVAKVTPAGVFTEYPLPTAGSWPSGITAGPDGNLWLVEAGFTRGQVSKVAKVTTSGVVTEYPIPIANSFPEGIAAGPDGNLWFTESTANYVAKVTTSGVFTEYPIPVDSNVTAVAAGPDGNLWFTEATLPGGGTGNKVAKVTTSGVVTEYTLPTANSEPMGIAAGPDGNLWVTELAGGNVAKLTTAGVFTEYSIPTAGSAPIGIAAGPDGNVWFAELMGNRVAKVLATPTPSSPNNVVALAGEASATVFWATPASSGTSPITGYTVTSTPGGISVTTNGSAASATVSGLTDGTAYGFTVVATNGSGTGKPSAPSNIVTPGRGQFHSLAPGRILDTRSGLGAPQTPLGQGRSLSVQITGQGNVPSSGVAAVVLNVTVTNTTAASFLTVWPAAVPRPNASNLNWTAGRTVPNLVEVAVGVGGKVAVFNAAGSTDVLFDVAGYVATPAATPGPDGLYNPVVPNRVLDTRDGTGGVPAHPLGAGATISVHVAGTLGIPTAGVAAVVLNVTVTGPTAPSFLTVFPTGVSRPNASNLNFAPGQTVPNRVIVQTGLNGTPGWVSFYNPAGSVHVIADIGGWFSDSSNPAATGSRFVGVTPARILDTRDGTGGFSQPLGAGQTIAATVAGRGGVPGMGDATPPSAVVLNVTVTGTTAASFLTAWPDLAGRPNASDLNWGAGLTVPNLVVVKLGSDGKIGLYNPAGATDVIIDVVGWYG